MSLNESHVEEAALAWFGELGYAVGRGPQPALVRCVNPLTDIDKYLSFDTCPLPAPNKKP